MRPHSLLPFLYLNRFLAQWGSNWSHILNPPLLATGPQITCTLTVHWEYYLPSLLHLIVVWATHNQYAGHGVLPRFEGIPDVSHGLPVICFIARLSFPSSVQRLAVSLCSERQTAPHVL